jgi:hypothetical protein
MTSSPQESFGPEHAPQVRVPDEPNDSDQQPNSVAGTGTDDTGSDDPGADDSDDAVLDDAGQPTPSDPGEPSG